jgi:TonB family protein
VKAPLAAFSEGGPHGLVIVDATVNTSGDVLNTKVISNTTGEEALGKMAEREIRAAKFVPPVRDCVPKTFIFTYKRTF